MTEYDRGAYTPHADAPLAFDPRSPRDRQPIPMTLVASSAILVVLVGAVFMAYRHGLHGGGGAMRTVGAPVGAVKTIAAPDAKPKDDAAQLDVYAAQNVQATPAFAPPPEAPAPRPAPDRLQVQASTPPPVRMEAPPAPVTTVQAAPALATGQGASTVISRGAADQDAAASAAHPRSAPPVRTAQAAPAEAASAHAAPAHAAKAATRAGALTIAAAEATDATIDAALARSREAVPSERATAPAPAKAKTSVLRSEGAEAATKPVKAVAAKATPKASASKASTSKAAALRTRRIHLRRCIRAASKTVAGKAAVTHGKALVQIGAFGSAAIADAQFAKLSSLTGGHGKAVSAVQAGGKTLYRTSVTGFADRASASAFCSRLAAAGHACIVKG